MDRRRAREKALQILFEIDFHAQELQPMEILENRLDLDDIKGKQGDFIRNLVLGTCENIEDINRILQMILEGWDLSRLGKVEKSVLRLAVYEMKYMDLSRGIVINEAVELTKTFSTDQAASFVNGVLAKYQLGDETASQGQEQVEGDTKLGK